MGGANFTSKCTGDSYYDQTKDMGHDDQVDCVDGNRGDCNVVTKVEVSTSGGSIDCSNERIVFNDDEVGWSCTNWSVASSGTVTLKKVSCQTGM